ncbi:MAG: terminase small subunit [Patescibacteria group bacterium]
MITEITKIKEPKLSLKQKLFCQAYVETRGNATEAVLRAGYSLSKKNGHPDRNLAKSIASENLTKPYISEYIKELLDKSGLNNENVAIQLKFLISQFSDLSVKLRAIDVYYKKTGAYAPEKQEVNSQFEISDDQLKRILGK